MTDKGAYLSDIELKSADLDFLYSRVPIRKMHDYSFIYIDVNLSCSTIMILR